MSYDKRCATCDNARMKRNIHVSLIDASHHDASHAHRVSSYVMQRIAHDDAQHDATRDDTLRATFVARCDTCEHVYDASYTRTFMRANTCTRTTFTYCKRCLRIARDDMSIEQFMYVYALCDA